VGRGLVVMLSSICSSSSSSSSSTQKVAGEGAVCVCACVCVLGGGGGGRAGQSTAEDSIAWHFRQRCFSTHAIHAMGECGEVPNMLQQHDKASCFIMQGAAPPLSESCQS
jgi:hypothetical protein